jgi:hypothetical protein
MYSLAVSNHAISNLGDSHRQVLVTAIATPLSPAVLQLLHILVAQVENREVPRLTSLRPNKDATVVATLEVLLALDRAIVLARWLVQRDPDPIAYARNFGYEANIGDCTSSSIRAREEAHAAREGQSCTYELVAATKIVVKLANDPFQGCDLAEKRREIGDIFVGLRVSSACG